MSRPRILALPVTAILIGSAALVGGAVLAAPASAANDVTPAKSACTQDPPKYACMKVNARQVPSGDTATFTGTLNATALKNLHDWTKGDDIVCLTRYTTSPNADGSWPAQMLEGACTTVRKDGGFTIKAELGRTGSYYYGVEMGPCRASADLCGNGDPGLLGVAGPRVVALKTT